MVVLHVKRNEKSLFLLETRSAERVAAVTAQTNEITNAILLIGAFAQVVEDLWARADAEAAAADGQEHKENDGANVNGGGGGADDSAAQDRSDAVIRELVDSDDEEDFSGAKGSDSGPKRLPPISADERSAINALIAEAVSYVSPDQAKANIQLSGAAVERHVDAIRQRLHALLEKGGFVAEDEPICALVRNDAKALSCVRDYMANEDACLWWASKQLAEDGDKTLADYVGKNDKTKIVVKICRKGTGAPTRETPVDEEMQKKMMAYYYKKQEEHKKLMADPNDDQFQRAQWANTDSLKNSFTGIGDVKWQMR